MRRIILLIFVLIGVAMITFILSQVLLDPVVLYMTEKTREESIPSIIAHYHLNDPWPIRFVFFLWYLVQGDWGYSRTLNQPVLNAIGSRFPATAELAILTIMWTLVVGVTFGIVSALHTGRAQDHFSRLTALAGASLPPFWLGLILQLVFFYYFDLIGLPSLPSNGRYNPMLTLDQQNRGFMILDSLIAGNFTLTRDLIAHIIMPSFVLGFGGLGFIMRIMRSSMLEVLRTDYIILARSKGLAEKIVLYRHALKNALIPTLTVSGLFFAGLLGGSPLVEVVFQWPGMGNMAVRAMSHNDSGLILGFTLILSLILVLTNLVVDLLYVYLDPRIRY